MTATEPLFEVRDLEVRFDTDEGVVRAVNGISYVLEGGGSLGIVGESGCGKSVSSLAVMGLLPQPAGRVVGGEVWFQGRDLLKLEGRAMRRVRGNHIAMIFQDPMSSLNPVLTVGRQIDEALRLHLGMNGKAAHARTVELLNMVGIPSATQRVSDYPHQFSGGMRQRAMIAMAVSCQPELLIADEPSTALDVTIQAQVIELIVRLRRELGMAVILITHDLALVAGFCDRIVVMYAGYIVEHATARELFYNPRHPYTLALLGSIPSLTGKRAERLTTIAGAPPDMLALPAGCPFAPRCRFVRDTCRTAVPPLADVADGHAIRCLIDVETGELR